MYIDFVYRVLLFILYSFIYLLFRVVNFDTLGRLRTLSHMNLGDKNMVTHAIRTIVRIRLNSKRIMRYNFLAKLIGYRKSHGKIKVLTTLNVTFKFKSKGTIAPLPWEPKWCCQNVLSQLKHMMLTVVVTISLTMVDSSLKIFQNPNHKFLPPTIFKELWSFKLFGHSFWQITTNYSFSPSFIFHQSHPFSIIFFLFRICLSSQANPTMNLKEFVPTVLCRNKLNSTLWPRLV